MNQVIQQDVPLSKSFIWDLQAKFYQSLGIDAWLSGTIPSRVTTNSHIAWRFARLIASYMADSGARSATIVEMGAGHGRFGYLCASHLDRLCQSHGMNEIQWRYVLTDVAERNLQYYGSHPAIQDLLKSGKVDIAHFDACVDSSLKLQNSKTTLSAENPTELIIVVANYFFDSLPMDVWQVTDGELSAYWPTVTVPQSASCTDKSNPEILKEIDVVWTQQPDTTLNYEDVSWNSLAGDLAGKIENGTFMFPVGAFRTLETIEKWSRGPLVLLTADKGYTQAEHYTGRGLPTLVKHGCFSFSLNFAALADWFELRGGTSFLPQHTCGQIEAAMMVTKTQTSELSRTKFEAEAMNQFTPAEYYQVTRRCEKNENDLQDCLSLVRLSCYEPLVLHRLRRAIRAGIRDAGSYERDALREILVRTSENYYHLNECDLHFTIAFLYQRLGDYELALKQYDKSREYYGEHCATSLNQAICHDELGRLSDALGCCAKSVELDPTDEDAREFHAYLAEKLNPVS